MLAVSLKILVTCLQADSHQMLPNYMVTVWHLITNSLYIPVCSHSQPMVKMTICQSCLHRKKREVNLEWTSSVWVFQCREFVPSTCIESEDVDFHLWDSLLFKGFMKWSKYILVMWCDVSPVENRWSTFKVSFEIVPTNQAYLLQKKLITVNLNMWFFSR